MTAVDMKKNFLILYDKITNFAAPGYDDEEISIFLTQGQERLVNRAFNPLGDKYKEGFEETEFLRKDLQELVKGTTITAPSLSQTNSLPNGVFYTLPNDCQYVISEELLTESDDRCKNGLRIGIKPITHDYYSINLKNPFKKPTVENRAWRLDYQDRRHEIITDGTYNIGAYYIRYTERLQPIITAAVTVNGVLGPLDCTLNVAIHDRIIDEAVKIATGVTTPELYQIKAIEQQQGK